MKQRSRRSRGLGMLRERGKGSWEWRFTVAGVTYSGTVKAESKAKAQEQLVDRIAKARDGTLPAPDRATVAGYFASWLSSPGARSPKTVERYGEIYRHQIAPHLGAEQLQKLRPEQIREWHGALVQTGISATTIGHAHRLLRLVLECAVREGLLARNVARVHKPPKAETAEIEILIAGPS